MSRVKNHDIWKKVVSTASYIAVSLILFYLPHRLPLSDLFKEIGSYSGLGILFALVISLWRDDRAHERALELQGNEQDFVFGTASHMANTVYDRHVIFCDEYIARLQKGFDELFKDGPTRATGNIGAELVRIRRNHAAWLTTEIEENLKPFEFLLIKIGTGHFRLEHTPVGEQRSKIVDEIYQAFGIALGEKKPETEEEQRMRFDAIVEHIRKLLGVEVFTNLRSRAAEVALARLGKKAA